MTPADTSVAMISAAFSASALSVNGAASSDSDQEHRFNWPAVINPFMSRWCWKNMQLIASPGSWFRVWFIDLLDCSENCVNILPSYVEAFVLPTRQNLFSFRLQFRIYGWGCHHMRCCFGDIENDDSQVSWRRGFWEEWNEFLKFIAPNKRSLLNKKLNMIVFFVLCLITVCFYSICYQP